MVRSGCAVSLNMNETPATGVRRGAHTLNDGFSPQKVIEEVAVVTGVAPGPPHRSERAGLPHSALILSFGVETRLWPRMTDLGRGQPPVHVFFHALPV